MRISRIGAPVLGLLAAALACAERPPPPYTRVEGPAPAALGASGPVLVVFWATWCGPCVEELPALRALAKDPPAGIRLVTFGEDEDEAPVRALLGGEPPRELGYRADADGRAAAAFGVSVLPASFLVVGGRLVARFDGPREWNSPEMRRLLARLASEGRPAAPPPARPGG